MKTYLEGQSLNHIKGYCRGNSNNKWCTSIAGGGFNYATTETGYPKSIFIDRDGNIRMFAYGAIDGNPEPYETVLKQLLGVP